MRTTYQPLVPAVHTGDEVAAGDRIGTLVSGHPGCPVAACLHWGLRRGHDYLDPLALLGLGQVRLLPTAARLRQNVWSAQPAKMAAPHLGRTVRWRPAASVSALQRRLLVDSDEVPAGGFRDWSTLPLPKARRIGFPLFAQPLPAR
jgi:murein DD-endopeptidase MepM/ murein hydrolase activator NlpD